MKTVNSDEIKRPIDGKPECRTQKRDLTLLILYYFTMNFFVFYKLGKNRGQLPIFTTLIILFHPSLPSCRQRSQALDRHLLSSPQSRHHIRTLRSLTRPSAYISYLRIPSSSKSHQTNPSHRHKIINHSSLKLSR